MIVVTGAAGKTGRAIIRALAGKGGEVRAFVRREEQRKAVLALGATQAVAGDLGRRTDITRVLQGAETVYCICPNVDPREEEYGQLLIEGAITAGVKRFGYHSVLHPQVERMPHHWRKLRVEEALLESGLPFTIFQPSAYMQNFLVQKQSIENSGILRVPYSMEAKLSLVDLEDVAAAVATVLTQPGHLNAIYELAGSQALNHLQIATAFSAVLGRPTQVEQISEEAWARSASQQGLDDYQIRTLRSMFAYYDRFGFRGNSNVLAYLLDREPTSFDEFLRRELSD